MEEKDIEVEFIDKCTARWLFEKTGVMLYEKALEKVPEEYQAKFQEIRDQEKEHEEMLEEIILRYGGDPQSLTPSARVTEIASEGLVKVIENEDFPAIVDALLNAELIDHANWELLIQLCEELEDDETKEYFQDAFEEEEEHLIYMRQLMEACVFGEVRRAA